MRGVLPLLFHSSACSLLIQSAVRFLRARTAWLLLLIGPALLFCSAGQANDSPWSVLQRAQQASQRLSYQGVLSVQSGKHIQSSRVTHVWDPQHGELEAIESLQGLSVEWIRHNEDVQCVMHDVKTIRMEKRHASQAFSRLMSARIEELSNRYTIAQKDGDRVAGMDSTIFELRPKDTLRFGYRLWIERETGLLLRSQTLGDNDEVIEQVSFSEIKVGSIPDKQRPKFKAAGEGWRLEDATVSAQEAVLPLQIAFKPGVPGFRQVSGVVRKTRNTTVNQYVYTDGLASVSIFVENFNPSRPQANAVIHHGAVRTIVKRVGDYSVTAMGEVPLPTVRQFLNEIDIRKP